jgi:hypothetical protein
MNRRTDARASGVIKDPKAYTSLEKKIKVWKC